MFEGSEVKGLPKVAPRVQGDLEDLRPESASPVTRGSRELRDQSSHQDESR